MPERRILYAEQYERIGTLPGFGVDVGLAVIGELKALITWGQGVPAQEVGTKYSADEYVILGEGGQWAERIICSQLGFGTVRTRGKTVNFILKSKTTPTTPRPTGWVACDYTEGNRIDEVRHGEIHASLEDAQRDAELEGYEGIRYVSTDGFLYMEP